MSEIEVSIICTTFNHEWYIGSALESFVCQETDFPFEVVVHDDASTDRTADIVREYAERYPEIIRPILQEENQYSKGRKASEIAIGESRGRFIAICEGDDYWNDRCKLQKQYNLMSGDSNNTFCFSNAYRQDACSGRVLDLMLPDCAFGNAEAGPVVVTMEQMLLVDFIPTASFFFPKEAYLRIPSLPERAYKGDRAVQIFLTFFGVALYVPEPLATYRVDVPNSMMSTWRDNYMLSVGIHEQFIQLYRFFDEYSEGKYRQEVRDFVAGKQYLQMRLLGDPMKIDRRTGWKQATKRGFVETIKYILLILAPPVYRALSGVGER